MIGKARRLRRDEIAKGPARFGSFPIRLLTKKVKPVQQSCARCVHIKLDIFTNRVRRKEAIDSTRSNQFLLDNLVEQRIRLGENLLRLRTLLLVIKNARIDTLQLPCV